MKKGDKVILEPKADNLFYRNKEVIIDKWIDEEKTFRVKWTYLYKTAFIYIKHTKLTINVSFVSTHQKKS